MNISVRLFHLPRRAGKKLTVTAPTNIFHLIYMAFQLCKQGPPSSIASIYRDITIETSSSNKSTHYKHYRVDYFPSGDISQERIDFLCNPSKCLSTPTNHPSYSITLHFGLHCMSISLSHPNSNSHTTQLLHVLGNCSTTESMALV